MAALTIDELAQQAGVSVRTVRYYISQGLLPGPAARGRAATYADDHLDRLRLIRRLAEQRVPLAEQRARLAQLSSTEVRDLLRQEDRQSAAREQARTSASPRAYVAELLSQARTGRPPASAPAPAAAPPAPRGGEEWIRFQLARGIELHVRSDARTTHPQLIERILQLAGRTT